MRETDPGTSCPMRHCGFTLIELLVVVAILALLIAILLPSLGRARKQAQQVKCAANMRTIGVGVHYYVNDHNGHMPAMGTSLRPNSWVAEISPYIKIKRSRAGSRLFLSCS